MIALRGVGERAAQGAAEGVEQRQTGDRLDQDRRAGDEMGDAARQQAEDDASGAVARRGDPAPRRIGRGVLAGAQSGDDRAEVDGVAAERRRQQGENARRGDQWSRRRPIAVGGEHRDAGQVLRRHGDDEQRQRQRDHRAERENRRRPYRRRRQPGEIETARAGKTDQDQRDDRRSGRGVKPLPARDEKPGDDDRRCGRRRLSEGVNRREAEPEQHAGEHRVGERRRDRRHQSAERTDQPGGDEQQADDEESAHRFGKTAGRRAGRGEQRGARRRPRRRDWHAGGEAQHDAGDAHRDRQRHQARRRLSVAGPDRRKPLEDDRERTGEADKGRHKARYDGLKKQGMAHAGRKPCNSREARA